MSDPIARLGQLLTGSEAAKLAARFSDGDTLTQALQGLAVGRRPEVRAALDAASVVPDNLALALPVLRAIQGAATARTTGISPIWTLPGYLADYGALTTSIKDLVLTARQSVTCSTFNFQKSSALWAALREVAARGTVEVLVYLDTHAADEGTWAGSPTSAEVAAQLVGAHVFRTRQVDGNLVRNHAKFIAVDHQFLVVTSANFSISAEQHNIELGLRVDSRATTEMVENQIFDAQTTLYERVVG
jgi:phosphatidylserine/phosphatidylglycerophosphate/cardiolipin synthase-like enzyme